ncbi:outer membrane beta-barrel protein [Aliagarivorans taiwanensis]|uniref:outer membrane beta-barrel protein n=1 Tax=Aliagarivorans taiwanensis TaxID=561966 RepID=UPI00047944FD|nr:outer membrane beta-barrel protein [Aliagarivorans taiwanensis]
MKNLIWLLMLPLSVAANALPSSNSPASKPFYLGANFAFVDSDGSIFDDSYSLFAGYDYRIDSEFGLFIEAEYRDFGSETFHWLGASGRSEAYSYGLNIKPVYHFEIQQRPIHFGPVFGVHHYHEKRRSTFEGDSQYHNNSSWGLLWGLEFGITLAERLQFNYGFKKSKPKLGDERRRYDQYYFGFNFLF